jgi:predicted nucleic acid-binding protein
MTPDVNVLIDAFRRDHQHHAVAVQWLDGARAWPVPRGAHPWHCCRW